MLGLGFGFLVVGKQRHIIIVTAARNPEIRFIPS